MSSNVMRCHLCEEPIGVYEPLITFLDGRPHETSRAAESHLNRAQVDCYHRACAAEHMDERDELSA